MSSVVTSSGTFHRLITKVLAPAKTNARRRPKTPSPTWMWPSPSTLSPLRLSPFSRDLRQARRWLSRAGGSLDGVVAKRLDEPYRSGERAMLKVKRLRTADCVVGGFRYATGTRAVGSLLLGLYDDDGRLDHVGFTSGFAAFDRKALTARLEALRGGSHSVIS